MYSSYMLSVQYNMKIKYGRLKMHTINPEASWSDHFNIFQSLFHIKIIIPAVNSSRESKNHEYL